MNTRRFNDQARKRSRYNVVRNQRCVRASGHGLLGDLSNQKTLRGSTRLFSLSQAVKLKEKGEQAEIRSIAQSMPDITIEQTYTAAEELYNVQMPIAEYPEPAETFDRSQWEDVDSSDDSDSDSEDGYGRMMKDGRRAEYRDYRNRRDRTNKTQRHWRPQLEPGVEAFMEWKLNESQGKVPSGDGGSTLELTVIDIFGTETRTIPLASDGYRSTSIIRAGLIPVAPLKHTAAFTTRTVMLYHALFVRCPRLGKQPFVKAICDMEGSPFKPNLSAQLSAAFDVYVALCNGMRRRVLEKLGRNGKNYRLMHMCPPCQLELREDEAMGIRMVVGMDGNDSLRRVERRGDAVELDDLTSGVGASVGGNEHVQNGEEGTSVRPSIERPDARVGGGDYFLSPAEVDIWEEQNWETVTELPLTGNLSSLEQLWNEGECENRWHNAKESNTARAAGNFLECGWFVLLCRHMLLLLACDMIRSGEQFKYPLATLNRYMSAEKEQREADGQGRPTGRLAVSYDINCKFSKTVARSPLRVLAEFMCFLPVIGTMHGYAHERLCQLLFLMLYIVSAGLEDGEFCERYFSIMNALASVTRHQSIFHRRQSIAEVAYHHDNFESYAQLSRFIYNNYKQALEILATKSTIAHEMRAQGITSPEIFYQWLQEEGEYLRSLCRTPPVETLEMDYLGKVEALRACQKRLLVIRGAHLMYDADDPEGTNVETKHRHEQENERKLLADVHVLEVKLKIKDRWVEDDANWVRVKGMVNEASYRKTLDKLEGLLVARIFEMSRLNVAGTGYKMRKHLCKAFKSRSKSIQTAIKAYNDAAKSLSPPRPTVSWEELMDLSFLGEFDILRQARTDVRERQWATQKNRLLMQQFFKLIRAEEEIQRLHLEICRLLTYMSREQSELLQRAAEVEREDPALALQIREHWLERGRFNNLHRQRLGAIKKLRGFERQNRKFFTVGTPVHAGVDIIMQDPEEGGSGGTHAGAQQTSGGDSEEGSEVSDGDFGRDGGFDGDEFDEEEEGELASRVEAVLSIASD